MTQEDKMTTEDNMTEPAYQFLPHIKNPTDLKKLQIAELDKLSSEIRHYLIESLAKTGGHLASNLGVVELTIALHYIFNSPNDQIIFDVGHQAYTHKILTGRIDQFPTLRQYEGLSGFYSRFESEHDAFLNGHGGTSISTALGMACASEQQKNEQRFAAVIGDGAMTEGMALEALNHLGHIQTPLLIVLNDNGMSIAPNVGGYSKYFDRVRNEPAVSNSQEYLRHLVKGMPLYGDRIYNLMSRVKGSFKYLIKPGMIFEELGLKYIGPIDGHNFQELLPNLERVIASGKPTILHVRTIKGKGFAPAENNISDCAKWHGGGPFNPVNGCFIKGEQKYSYSEIFGKTMIELAVKDPAVCAVTAAMCDGTGLHDFAAEFPEKLFDVAMAEQHAIAFSAGLCNAGLKPFAAIYSTFVQRAYDQIFHEMCLQKIPVRLCLDRGGLVGEDGPTHHGCYDFAFLRCLPEITVMAPANGCELIAMLHFMHKWDKGPTVVRYPREFAGNHLDFANPETIEYGKGELVQEGSDISLIAIGCMVPRTLKLAENLKASGISAAVINARFVKPLDEELIISEAKRTGHIITLEDNCLAGGFGSAVLELLSDHSLRVRTKRFGIPDLFIPHGSREKLFKHCQLDNENLHRSVVEWFNA
jgi:1-deoxy-D-xylulose-5-phosphate synthase